MPSFDVKPIITLSDGAKDIQVAALVSWQHKDNELRVRLSDTMFKDGVSTNGLRLGVKNDRFELDYDMVRLYDQLPRKIRVGAATF